MPFPPVRDGRPAAAQKYLCLAGPTASGKSAAALAIAEALAADVTVEIVSVDSALVYRGMDIGTAKPSAADRARVPHHLIDIIEPSDTYSAARFVADATRVIGEISGRGHLPLLVGGTMLYFKALADGLDTMPAADPTVRAALDAQATHAGWPALHAELAAVDPVTAQRLAPNDAQRIQRALEVFRVSGVAMSSWQRGGSTEGRVPPPAMISLEPVDRAWLHERIARRFALMLGDGLVDEIRSLRARGDLRADLPSMRCVGYRQIWQALDGGGDSQAAAEQAVAATRQLAKRQMTWLRAMPWRQTVACDSADALAQVVDRARCWLATPPGR